MQIVRHDLPLEKQEFIILDLSRYKTTLDRGASRWKEAIWILLKLLLFLPNYPIPSRVRVFFLRRLGAKIGDGVVIRSNTNIAFPWRLTIGNHVWIGEGVQLLNLETIHIGSNCCISQRAFLCTGSHDFRKPTFDLIVRPISVGEGCWVGAAAFIGPGVTTGDGTFVTAGTVVTKTLPPNSIAKPNAMVVDLLASPTEKLCT